MAHPCMIPWIAFVCMMVAGSTAPAETYEAPVDVRETAEGRFTLKPQTEKVGETLKIRFAVSAPTDVEVAILDAGGNVVRHLAAGLLGEHAPAPLQKNSLKQELTWDGKDDAGKPVEAARVRVRLRLETELEKYLGRSHEWH